MTLGLEIANALDPYRVPSSWLLALYNRDFTIALQPWQFLIRAAHVLMVSLFFGAIAVLDLRLLGLAPELPLRPLLKLVLPSVYVSLGLTMLTGFALFFYDPVAVGSHDWLTPKLLFIALGFVNAIWFNWRYLPAQLVSTSGLTTAGKLAAAASLALWALAILCACLNAEPPPRLYLGS
ncbi:hypothetical protein [Acidocella sp. KAb 2-4]|uniref:hypothetical protein n=1 Tax=Acidocella sp. KAb 2-4 TaxID=2885158 RepID=UPI001D08AA19|nr:hypothetical protein [Acidocella sp. KAb 2-4]MCB5945568.1 hypothetical protein [Acidocella sp. KAb 2-4]